MTPEEKIVALVEHIKKEFPKGCQDIQDCETCPINIAGHDTLEEYVCDMLSWMDRNMN